MLTPVLQLYAATNPQTPTLLTTSDVAIVAGYIRKVVYYNSGTVPAKVTIRVNSADHIVKTLVPKDRYEFTLDGPFNSDGSSLTHRASVSSTITQTTVLAS
jgi:hypothetical protein